MGEIATLRKAEQFLSQQKGIQQLTSSQQRQELEQTIDATKSMRFLQSKHLFSPRKTT
jgi:uncharacterized membrane protein YccC